MSLSLRDLLEPSAICLNYTARDSADVVTHLGDLLLAAGYVKETFVEAALARETEMPTGLPLAGEVNAAIPHTDVEHVLKPGAAMATLVTPVTFRNMVAPDQDVPVRLVFLLALDQPKAQIQMLQEIAGVLQRPELVAQLVAAQDGAQVQAALNQT